MVWEPSRRWVKVGKGKVGKGKVGKGYIKGALGCHARTLSSFTVNSPGSPGHASSTIFSSRHLVSVTTTMKQTLTAAAVLSWAALTQHAFARRLDWEGEPLPTPRSVFVTWESSLNTGKQIIFCCRQRGILSPHLCLRQQSDPWRRPHPGQSRRDRHRGNHHRRKPLCYRL
jgi:hypothetical protein